MIAVYSRKSVYTGKGESIENQLEMCKDYLLSNFKITEDEISFYEDEGFSGKSLDRPQFQKMLANMRQGRFSHIVCYRLDRISRNVGDFSALIEELNRRGISFICIKEKFDTSTPMGKAMMYIASVFAQLERETIAERVRDNMFMLAKTGRWLGGTTPMGFLSEKQTEIGLDGKKKTFCSLCGDPREIAVVRTIYQEFLALRTLSGVLRYLQNHHLKSRSGGGFSLPGIKEILQNPVYCTADKIALDYFLKQNAIVCFAEEECGQGLGLISYSKRDYRQKGAPRQNKEHWIIAAGKHKGIISGRQWTKVQYLLEKPAEKISIHNHNSLLSGQIACGICGNKLFAKNRSNHHAYYDYICQSKLTGGTKQCPCQNLNGIKTDQAAFDSLCSILAQSLSLHSVLQKWKRKNYPTEKDFSLEDRIQKYQLEMENLIQSLAQTAPSPAFSEQVNQKITKLSNVVKELEEKKRYPSAAAKVAHAEDFLDMRHLLSSLTLEEKRRLVKVMVQNIVWKEKELHVYLYAAK